ncbi:MAG: SUMF1/EgtB/PvdO family nonheme iron enzyme [Steroidobacteraceae bacterium]
MTELRLIEPLGARPLMAADFPLTFGGGGAAVRLPGAAEGEVLAALERGDGGLVLVPAAADVALGEGHLAGPVPFGHGAVATFGGARLSLTHEGGVDCLRVTHSAPRADTLPPVGAQTLGGMSEAGSGDDRLVVEPVEYSPPAAPAPRRTIDALPRRRHVVFAILAVVVAGVLAFLLRAGTVIVRTVPGVDPRSIGLDGTLFEVAAAGRILALPGDYDLEVVADGYRRVRQRVTVTGASGQEVVVPLERLPGRVRFTVRGVQGTLSVDGIEKGRVPGEYELPAGRRQLLVTAPRYLPFRAAFDVRGGGESQTLKVMLAPDFARVTFVSEPAGAVVRVDAKELGRTPLAADVDAGRRTVTLEHPDFRPWVAPLTVRAGQPATVGPVQLGLPDGALTVRTSPAGADVSVAGRYRGRTPLTLGLAAGSPHEVVLNKAGYAPVTRTVQVAPRETRAVDVALSAVFGEVVVHGEPADAELVVDGIARGRAVQTLKLPAAPHAIEIRKPGYEPHRVSVVPREGLAQVIDFSLIRTADVAVARLPARISTSLGGELRLVRGGRYTMGSARREPGRRSNESQHEVELRRPFYIGLREVTNREFRAFRKEHASGLYREETLDLDRQPVANVGWAEAAAFCNWLSQKEGLPPAYVEKDGRTVLADPVTTGYRLPTEAEWEFVARFDGAAATLRYPWGNELPLKPGSGNYADRSAEFLSVEVLPDYDDGARVAASVGGYAPNALGVYDLGGNVREWTHDWYGIYVGGSGSVAVDPTGPAEGTGHVLRGSSWLTARIADLRLAWRDSGGGARPDVGFRLARYAE